MSSYLSPQFNYMIFHIITCILKENEFGKSRRVLAAIGESLVYEHAKGNKLQAAWAIDENKEEGENSATPIQLHFKELNGSFYPYNGFPARDENPNLR